MTAPDQTAEIPTPLTDAALNHVSSETMITLCRKLEKANVMLRQDAERLAEMCDRYRDEGRARGIVSRKLLDAIDHHRALMDDLDKEGGR